MGLNRQLTVGAALAAVGAALPQSPNFALINAAPTVADGPSLVVNPDGVQTASLLTSFTVGGPKAAASTAAAAKRELTARGFFGSNVVDSAYNAQFGTLSQQSTVQAGVSYWINGGSTHNFFGNLNNNGRIVVSQTQYLTQNPVAGGQTCDFVGHDANNGNLVNAAGASISLNDYGSISAPTYDWYLHSMNNSGTLQFCGRGDTGGSTYQLYSDLDAVNNGLISFEQYFNNYGASFVWRNPTLTTTSTGYNLYNNGAFRIINVVYHNVQNVYGSGCWEIGAGGVLYLEDGTGVYQNPSAGPSFPGQSIIFQDSTSVLHMDTAVYSRNSNFGAQVYGFGQGNAIEFYQTIQTYSYSSATGVLNVAFIGGYKVNIKLGLGYDASKFSKKNNPQKYNVAGYNAIFYAGVAPGQNVPSQCQITAPICSGLGGGLPSVSIPVPTSTVSLPSSIPVPPITTIPLTSSSIPVPPISIPSLTSSSIPVPPVTTPSTSISIPVTVPSTSISIPVPPISIPSTSISIPVTVPSTSISIPVPPISIPSTSISIPVTTPSISISIPVTIPSTSISIPVTLPTSIPSLSTSISSAPISIPTIPTTTKAKTCPVSSYTPYYPALATHYTTDPALTGTTTANQPCPTTPEAGTYCGFINPEDPCAPQPDGYGPVPTPDTASAFLALPSLHALASSAPVVIPASDLNGVYTQVFRDLNASVSAQSYLGLHVLPSYNASQCAALCDCTDLCSSFNLYAERDPSLAPSANDSSAATVWGYWCPNPPSMTSFKCTLWGSAISASDATNAGQSREQFQVVVGASDGWDKTASASAPAVAGWKAPVNAGARAIDAASFFVSAKFFAGPFNPQVCGDFAAAQGAKNVAAGQPAGVAMFNAYYVNKNGVPYGTYCGLYSSVLDAATYATWSEGTVGGDTFDCTQSWLYGIQA